MQDDDLTKALRGIKADLFEPHRNLSEEAKDKLIAAIGGPKTAKIIVKAGKELPISRIAFLFNRLDTTLVFDILANDMEAAIKRAEVKKKGEMP